MKPSTPAQTTLAINGRMYGNTNESYPLFTDEIELTVLCSEDKYNALKVGLEVGYETFLLN